ncbi:MAG: ATP synthase F1 subunit gamma [Candidatus Magasanikbacteria bacterium]
MGVNTKAIKRRIKSVSSTKKITKAMEMVAAAKMRKAVDTALKTRTYAKLAWDILVDLSKTQKSEIALLKTRRVKKVLLILITSNRGLCGSFNSNIIKKTAIQMNNPKNLSRQRIEGKDLETEGPVLVDVLGLGKKGAEFSKKMGYNLIASFTDISDTPGLKDILPICKMAIDEYANKNYDKVVVAYTDFKSAINQVPKIRQVLPISEIDLEKMMGDIGEEDLQKEKTKIVADTKVGDYLFEPGRDEVLEIILPRLVESQVLQAALESAASEHSSRMVAMRSASDAAVEMIDELNLNFNKARQAGITQEIAEIAGGAAALE